MNMKNLPGILLGIFIALLILCAVVYFLLAPARSETFSSIEIISTEADMTFQLTSDAFSNGQSIPAKYSCVGKNISPALSWNDPPAGTQSFALIVDDLDAPGGTWTHWVLYNIPAGARSLQEDLPIGGENNPILFGKNSWGDVAYGGPCPPGGTHRYYFKLYALDIEFPILAPSATKEQVLHAIQGHILAQTELMGTFSK